MNRRGTESTEKTSGNRAVVWLVSLCVLPLCSLCLCGSFRSGDPATWGSDHVGKPVPEYVTGDECLFCHRANIGPTWGQNVHNLTVRDTDPKSAALSALQSAPGLKKFAAEVRILMGNKRRQRFLKPAEGYGKLDLLDVAWTPPQHGAPGRLLATEQPHWDSKRFGEACAGCHATAVDVKERSFAARSLDCYACHGEVVLEHSKNTALVHLSRKRKDDGRVVTSICAQCHVRTGKSRSTGLPYPNNFVAGDNLFRDFQVDLAEEQIKKQNPADAHVQENVRNVVILGKSEVTCLSCHDVHRQATTKHHLVQHSELCLHCHNANGSKKIRKKYEVHSTTCEY